MVKSRPRLSWPEVVRARRPRHPRHRRQSGWQAGAAVIAAVILFFALLVHLFYNVLLGDPFPPARGPSGPKAFITKEGVQVFVGPGGTSSQRLSSAPPAPTSYSCSHCCHTRSTGPDRFAALGHHLHPSW